MTSGLPPNERTEGEQINNPLRGRDGAPAAPIPGIPSEKFSSAPGASSDDNVNTIPSEKEPLDPVPLEDENIIPKAAPTSSHHFKDTFKNLKKEDFVNYARNNTIDTAAYAILIIGIILLLFTPFLGQIFIGAVAGYYFSEEIITFLRNGRLFIDNEPIVRSLILAGVALAFFISSPFLFVTILIAATVKYLIFKNH